jgi:hypothetical protein
MNLSKKVGAERPLTTGVPQNEPARQKAVPTRAVLVGALLSWPLAYFYVRGVLFAAGGPKTAGPLLFAVLFLLGVTRMARAQHRVPCREAPFWAACWLIQSAVLTVLGWQPEPIGVWQGIVWHLTAVYWVLARTGMLTAQQSGSLCFLDAWAGGVQLPWQNIGGRMFVVAHSIHTGWTAGRARRPAGFGRLWAVLGSAAAALLVCTLAWGQLAAANAHFAALGSGVLGWLGNWLDGLFFGQEIVWFALSIPVGAWLFGLVYGSLRRSAPPISASAFFAKLAPVRVLPGLTLGMVAGALCAVYTLFFAVQTVDFAAALAEGITVVEICRYAVNGFWEMCRILLLNFGVLAVFFFFGRSDVRQNHRWRAAALALGAFGGPFVALAGAKLGAYLFWYGLTPRRVLSGWFLCVLGAWQVLALLWLCKKRRFSAARLAIWILAGSFTALCCFPWAG